MWTFWFGENLWSLLDIKPQILGPPAHSLVKVYNRQYIKEAIPYTETSLPTKHVSLHKKQFTMRQLALRMQWRREKVIGAASEPASERNLFPATAVAAERHGAKSTIHRWIFPTPEHRNITATLLKEAL